MTLRAAGPALVVALLVPAASACGATRVDTSPATTEPSPTAATLPADGDAALDALTAETSALSARLTDNDGQQDALARIEALWSTARPTVEADRPELLEGFEAVVDLLRRSVERRRPADADKAHKNLLTLLAALPA